MKDRIERFVILPFSMGCSSHSSVSVAVPTRADHNKKLKPLADPPIKRGEEGEECSSFDGDDKKIEASGILASPKANTNASEGIFRFIKSLKSFSHLFVGYRDGTGETEAEMEIGFPTDVKHVTHIGLDGTVTTSIGAGGGWENLHPPDVASSAAPSSFPLGRVPLATV